MLRHRPHDGKAAPKEAIHPARVLRGKARPQDARFIPGPGANHDGRELDSFPHRLPVPHYLIRIQIDPSLNAPVRAQGLECHFRALHSLRP